MNFFSSCDCGEYRENACVTRPIRDTSTEIKWLIERRDNSNGVTNFSSFVMSTPQSIRSRENDDLMNEY